METNYVLLVGLFLLLVAVDCSGADPKGNVNEKTGLDQSVDGKADSVEENFDSKSILDSISKVKDNGGDQIDGSERGIYSDSSNSNSNQQSGSNEGEKLLKDGKESSAEEKGKTGGRKEGDEVQKGLEELKVKAKGKTAGEKEGINVQEGQEESTAEVKGNTDGEKDGNNVNKGQEEAQAEAKGKTDGEKERNNVQKGQEEPKVKAKGKTAGEKEGTSLQKGQEESKAEVKGKTDGEKEGNNVSKGQEEPKVEAKGKTDGEKKRNNMQNGQEKSNVEAEGKTDSEKEGNNTQKGLEESNAGTKEKSGNEKEADNVQKGKEESTFVANTKTDGEKMENPNDIVDPKKMIKQKDSTKDSAQLPPPPPPTRNDGIRESPDLLLLIQNKGNGTLALKISAPAFVQLDETDVVLKEKQDKKVKISIKNSGTGNLIILKDGNGECSLDFKDLIAYNSAKSYINFLSQTPTTAFIFAAAILILASRWMCKSFRWRASTRCGLKYQRLDTELPVSGGAIREPNVNDGWDNSWGDNWDDEEAAMTPSMPVTPSLSSKGLASRRLSKEGWKD